LNTTKIAENFTSLLSKNVKEKRSDFVKTVLGKTHQVMSPRQATVLERKIAEKIDVSVDENYSIWPSFAGSQ
jgi:deoxyribose-phosphate aldolase